MEDTSTLGRLRQERKEISSQISDLQEDLKAADRLIQRLSRNGVQASSNASSVGQMEKPFGATGAIKYILLNESAGKRLKPPEIRDRLIQMKESGMLETASKDLLPIVHQVLKRLVETEVIPKAKKGKYGNI